MVTQFSGRTGLYGVLLLTGILLLVVHYVFAFSARVQLLFFAVGVLTVGLPHGSADVLVGRQNAILYRQGFSLTSFLFQYLLKVAAFALLFFFFPFVALLLFVLLAAFHFGETDLQQFDTRSVVGKGFAFSYGLLILTFILGLHFDEVIPILQAMGINSGELQVLEWLGRQKLLILSLSLLLFFSTTFVYGCYYRRAHLPNEQFLLHLIILFPLLYALPLLVGFTFYFVIWHSVLSLTDIIHYLRHEGRHSASVIWRHLFLYTGLALSGLLLLCGGTWIFFNGQTLLVGFLLALAVLTAPHMNVMHDMYRHLRKNLS